MENLDIEYIHEMELSILHKIDDLCKRHNIKYFLIGGTLIGAVRHKGFIPWDDDLDIAMFRNDYETFIKIAKKEFCGPYQLIDFRDDVKYPRTFAKVFRTDTKYCSKYYRELYKETGIWIDIFPIDLINAKNIEEAKQKARKRMSWATILAIVDENRNKQDCRLSIKMKLLCKFMKIFSVITIRNLMVKIYTIDNKKKCKYITNYGRGVRTQTMSIDCFVPGKYLDFEGQKILAPEKYDEVLTNSYGDYMRLPNVEERVPKHDLVRKNNL